MNTTTAASLPIDVITHLFMLSPYETMARAVATCVCFEELLQDQLNARAFNERSSLHRDQLRALVRNILTRSLRKSLPRRAHYWLSACNPIGKATNGGPHARASAIVPNQRLNNYRRAGNSKIEYWTSIGVKLVADPSIQNVKNLVLTKTYSKWSRAECESVGNAILACVYLPAQRF